MRLICTVCRELLSASDHVNVAPCGHYLHNQCWVEWLERAETCPQCRTETTAEQLVRLFFNVADDTETNEPNTATLIDRIDSLTIEMHCKSEDLENTKQLLEQQEGQNNNLRDEISRYRDEIEKVEAANANLQERISDLQQQSRVADKEVQKLRRKVMRLEEAVNQYEQEEDIHIQEMAFIKAFLGVCLFLCAVLCTAIIEGP